MELFPGIIDKVKLGKFKLEYIIRRAVFLAPKCYYLVLENGEEIVKIKGLNYDKMKEKLAAKGASPFTFDDFKSLLTEKAKLELTHEKWMKDFNSTIHIKETSYNLKQTSNKRSLIMKDGVCVNTEPLVYTQDNFELKDIEEIILCEAKVVDSAEENKETKQEEEREEKEWEEREV